MYVCFDRDRAGEVGAEKVAGLLPQARIVRLPEEVGESADVTDFFVRRKKSRGEFLELLQQAEPLPLPLPQQSRGQSPVPNNRSEIEALKRSVRIEEIARRYLELQPNGQRFIARCPFHEDQHPSFVLYPESQSFYCFGCQAYGDVITFLMRIERLTFPEALDALRKIASPAA